MKLLHTADWHVGRTLHRRQRLDECAAVLDEVVEIARDEAGRRSCSCAATSSSTSRRRRRPSGSSTGRCSTCAPPAPQVVVVPGNHDNAKRFGAVEQLFAAAGRPARAGGAPAERGRHRRAHRARRHTRAEIACLPWVAERLLFSAADMMREQEEPFKEYAEELPRLIARAVRAA